MSGWGLAFYRVRYASAVFSNFANVAFAEALSLTFIMINKDKVKFFFRQQLLLLASLYVMTFGVSLFIRSNLGSSAISVTPLVWSAAGLGGVCVGGFCVPPLTVGGYTIIMNTIFVILQILILRGRYQPVQLFQLVIGAIFSVFLDVNMSLTSPLEAGSDPAGVAWGLFLVAVAGVIMGVGVACEVRCRSVMMPGEGIQVAISKVSGKEFSKVKIVVDSTLVAIGVACSVVFFGIWRWDIVGLGTIISMVYIGVMVRVLSPHLSWFDRLLNYPEKDVEAASAHSIGDACPLVIAISRQYGSGGREIGRLVSERLGIDLYDNALIEEAAKDMQIEPHEVAAREQNISTPRLVEMLIMGNDIPKGAMLSTDDRLFVSQSRFIRDVASVKYCVIIGRCADFILRGRPNLLRVFIRSSSDFAAKRIAEECGCDVASALDKISDVNSARANHYYNYTSGRWGDAANYDIVINTAFVGIEGAVDIICRLAQERNVKA